MVDAQDPQQEGTPLIADAAALEEFRSLPPADRQLSAALRGVLAETATTGLQRYPWPLLKPLLHSLLDALLAEYGHQQQMGEDEAGPPAPLPLPPGCESIDQLSAQLHEQLEAHEAAPFTLQRLCEVLLEPRKQYARLDKVASAVEKLLLVTSTCQPAALPPPRPSLSSLRPVNDNPHSPYLDGRPPQLVHPMTQQQQQQHELQGQLAAQQQHEQQQQGWPHPEVLGNGVGPSLPEQQELRIYHMPMQSGAELLASLEVAASLPPIDTLGHPRPAAPPPQAPLGPAEVLRAQVFVESVVGPSAQPGGSAAAAAGDVEMEGSPSPLGRRPGADAAGGEESVPPTPEGPNRPHSAEPAAPGDTAAVTWAAGDAMDEDRPGAGTPQAVATPAADGASADAPAAGELGSPAEAEPAAMEEQVQGTADAAGGAAPSMAAADEAP